MKTKNVLIIGSGVSGLSTALLVAQKGHNVTVWQRENPGTFPRTSLNAWATWWPVMDATDDRLEVWNRNTLSWFTGLADDTDTGIVMRQIFSLQREMSEPWYDGKYDCFRYAELGEIARQYEGAFVMDTAPVIDPGKYLPWLYRQAKAEGVVFKKRVVKQLAGTPEEFDVVINCAGLDARELADDRTVFAARLQVLRIAHNGFDKAVFDDSGPTAIVPHEDHIRIGAVYEERIESLTPDESLNEDILDRVRAMVPGFQVEVSDIRSTTRVLRPEREGYHIRVEKDELPDGRLLIHNYGHDGMGYGSTYGIAEEIAGYIE